MMEHTITYADGRIGKVVADYVKIENGVLIFRNVGNATCYPTFVGAAAAGVWLTVESKPVSDEDVSTNVSSSEGLSDAARRAAHEAALRMECTDDT